MASTSIDQSKIGTSLAKLYLYSNTREDLTEKRHFGSSILNFETVAPLADECAVLADCQMKLQYKLYVQLFIRY